MNAAFAASNMVNQPQRPRGIADPTLGAAFFFAVFFLLPRLRRSRRGFDGRSCAYYGTLQTPLSRPGRTTRLIASQIGSHHGTLRCGKNHPGVTKNREKEEPQALLDAGLARLRPVMITVGATSLALFPLAVHGEPLWQPLCYPRRGGPGLATIITLSLVRVL